MKWNYALLADAANDSGGKLNALGMGIRMIRPPRLPVAVPAVFLAAAEADSTELGPQELKITLETPDRKRQTLVDQTVQANARPADEADLPVEIRLLLSFPLLAQSEGLHTIRAQIGKARTSYAYLVRIVESEEPTPAK